MPTVLSSTDNIPTVNSKTYQGITFTKEQIDYLEKEYPELQLGPNVSEEALRFYHGQRSVVLQLRDRFT